MNDSHLVTERAVPDRPAATGDRVPDPSFDQLYSEHVPLLRAIAMRRGVPFSESEELVQEVFATYLVDPDRVHNVRAYLVGGICHAIRAYRRRCEREGKVFAELDDEADVPAFRASNAFESLSDSLTLAAVLSRIGGKCRSLLQRVYVDKESKESIAADLDYRPATIDQLLFSCRKRAREEFLKLMGHA